MPKVDNFFRQILPNGLKVIFEKRDTPLVATLAATKFGPGHDPAELKGVAHLIEHTVFRKTKKRSGEEVTSLIEDKGGDIDAFIIPELTAYYTKLGADHFETGMDVIADIMLNPSLTKKDMDMEKKIILQEIKMKHDSPEKHVLIKLSEQMYAKPFGMPLAGTPSTIKKITRRMLQKYHNIHYSPSNIVVAVVGKAEVDHIWNLSRKYFMKKQVQKQIEKENPLQISEGSFGKFIEKRKEIDQAHIALGYHMPNLKNELRYAAEVFNNILGVGFSSRLFQVIRERKGLAYVVQSGLEQGTNYADGYIYMATDKEKAESAIKLAIAELKKLQKVDKKEVEGSKEQLIGRYLIESEDSEHVALRLLEEEFNGDAKEYYQYEEKIRSVTVEQVREVAKQIDKIATSMILPE